MKDIKEITVKDRPKIENVEKDFTRERLKEVPDGLISKNEAAYKKCKRRADNLKELKDKDSGNYLFPMIKTAKEYIDYFKDLVEEENLRFFERLHKEDFASYVYHFIINKGYELPLSFEELVDNYSLNADANKNITAVQELFFNDYYKGLKEVKDLIETEYIDYYEYYLSLVKKEMEVKKKDEKRKS
jgi:hypothetical protein